MTSEIRLGISSCLLGQAVRYNGGHKLEPFLRDTIGRHVRFVPVCPEVECGLPVPREAMHLAGDVAAPRLVAVRSGVDQTERMQHWIRMRLVELEAQALSGFIFKRKSPSCGLAKIKVHDRNGNEIGESGGLFARAFTAHFPLIPVEEEDRLHDPGLREDFFERIFAMQRWRRCLEQEKRPGNLVDFHSREKYFLLSHSTEAYRRLGRIVAQGGKKPIAIVYDEYGVHFQAALQSSPTPARHDNVLQHMLGYFKKRLGAEEKQEMLDIIAAYRAGRLPLIVPVTLINHYVRKYEQPYLARQTYLNPHPTAWNLRCHA